MRVVKGTLLGIGALALVALLTTLIAPKVVLAAAEALVQVANTPTTAVPVTQAPAAGQIYIAQCSGVWSNTPVATCSLPPVPSGQTLFVETASFWTQVGDGVALETAAVGYYNSQAATGTYNLYVPMTLQGGANYNGTVGARFPVPGGTGGNDAAFYCNVFLNNSAYSGFFICNVYGYLVPAQ